MRRSALLGLVIGAAVLGSYFPGVTSAFAVDACDPDTPATCTTRELATMAGIRLGSTLEPNEAVDAQYAATLAANFTALTPENALKLYTVRPAADTWNWGPADAVVDFATDHGMEIRGHTLVWAQDQFTPAWVRAIDDPAELQAVVDDEITSVMDRYRGRIHRYDVVNEPLESLGTGLSDSVFWNLGPDWVARAFRLAHTTDPTAELWLNETTTEWVPGKHAAFLSFVQGLLDEGVPIDGIGIQTHLLGPDIDRAEYEQQLRDFTDLGLRVAVTELDVPVAPSDPDAFTKQAEAYRTVVDACIAVPGCREVTTWGLTDASTWLDTMGIWPTPTRPLLFDDTFTPKPAYDAVRDSLAAAATNSRVSVSSVRTIEGDRRTHSVVFTVTLSEPPTRDITLDTRIVPISASLGTDLAIDTDWHPIVFRAGTTTRTVPVSVVPDAVAEPSELFAFVVARPTGGYRVAEGVGAGIIVDDDTAPSSARVDVGDAWVVEGDRGAAGSPANQSALTVTLSQPASAPVSLRVDIGGALQTVAVPAGRTSVVVRVANTPDAVAGATRSVRVRVVSVPRNFRIGRGAGTLTVLDDD